MFQSTPLCEGRPELMIDQAQDAAFQSTPLCEGRHDIVSIVVTDPLKFQSTPLCEGRRRSPFPPRRANRFNPRPSVRGDASAASAERSISPFQSTPLCEGRQTARLWDDYRGMFQSTPLCEGRHLGRRLLSTLHRFNPRPSVRGDRDGGDRSQYHRVSIHAPL